MIIMINIIAKITIALHRIHIKSEVVQVTFQVDVYVKWNRVFYKTLTEYSYNKTN